MDNFMDTLQRSANHPIWMEKEITRFLYNFPLPYLSSDQSLIEIGKELAKRAGIPEAKWLQLGPFLTYLSPLSHIGPFLHAVDFLVPDGTNVLAANDGRIVEFEESHDVWGNDPNFMDQVNHVSILHQSMLGTEISQYCHLEKGSISHFGLKVGSKVKAGQPIAKVGKTGWTEGDHLHFIVIRTDYDSDNSYGFKSLEIQFDVLE
jgi:murein DD-endopeptidase MepM/ murein hydrolase activator NlpD